MPPSFKGIWNKKVSYHADYLITTKQEPPDELV